MPHNCKTMEARKKLRMDLLLFENIHYFVIYLRSYHFTIKFGNTI
jgi:hypothetical protein